MTMDALRIVKQPATPETLAAYATVSPAMWVESRLDLDALQDPDGRRFVEVHLAEPLLMDNDAHESPSEWASRGDLHRWTLLCAYVGQALAGGAIVALWPDDDWFFRPEPGVAVLRDIRVDADFRGRGIGSHLMNAAIASAVEAGCRRLAIETQDINVPACHLYASAGATLGEVRRGAYREFPDQAALLWFVELAAA
jgi:ribosomal protein S18 acetylase RimI-like enzyme